jgi:hypothetical protein
MAEGYEFVKGKEMEKCIIYPMLINLYMSYIVTHENGVIVEKRAKKK